MKTNRRESHGNLRILRRILHFVRNESIKIDINRIEQAGNHQENYIRRMESECERIVTGFRATLKTEGQRFTVSPRSVFYLSKYPLNL